MKERIIASITRVEQIEKVLASSVRRVNLMTGDITTLASIVKQLHEADKQVYVHMEMVNGLGRDTSAIQYMAQTFKVDGIVTTKSNAVAAARNAGIRSIQRVFAIDTAAVETAIRMIHTSKPDEVELMPGLMPRIIREVKGKVSQPLIVGGLIRYEEEIQEALDNNADFVSVGHHQFW
ncbi:glycerol-3-phosphate responsive antiterminator [Paenibacillus sambharensis]|uniref:Glycerol uptake operon antiterminator regulatory protein n=1 Tax=Paenibacillus sambharensis TaxID=1803190 RepID=A0A2W1L435_9BACL|nr:glycerol-3-phosphate responsive antiterminator [Paenibacillus sambharensis]PZD94778.1 glycerol-3-phosphate responsive antiterminator [Paenibacillus sambharensis]